MRFFVKAEVFESITSDADVSRLRQAVGKQLQKIMKSGKLELGWVAADSRCPMFIFNVDSAAELRDLLGNALIDQFRIETHPITGFDELGKYFAENPPGR